MNFPLIGDPDRTVADLYDMIHPNALNTLTVRSVFIISPDKKLQLTMTYPMTVGRNFAEVLRALDGLQRTWQQPLATPANWIAGQDVIVALALDDTAAEQKFGKLDKKLPYLRYAKNPG